MQMRAWIVSIAAAIVLIGGFGNTASAQGQPPAKSNRQRVDLIPGQGELYRLVGLGGVGPDGKSRVSPVRGTSSCCDEVRTGWLLFRDGRWVAVDTVVEP